MHVTVTRSQLLKLIDSIVHTICSTDYDLVHHDEHYRTLLSDQVDAILVLAEESGFDPWVETACPVGCEDDTPIAILLRRADAEFGVRHTCAVWGCSTSRAPLIPRPASLPHGTRWPTCPELCAFHAALRLRVLQARVHHELPAHTGPVAANGMPLPAFVGFAPSPEQLSNLEAAD